MEENILAIIDRIKKLKGVHSDTQVAKLLEITRENLNNYKRRSSVPRKAIETFCLKEGYSLNFILHGTEPIRISDQNQAVNESPETYLDDDHLRELLGSAHKVLTSGNKMASEALEKNIRYFAYAVEMEKRIGRIERQMQVLEDLLRRKVPPKPESAHGDELGENVAEDKIN